MVAWIYMEEGEDDKGRVVTIGYLKGSLSVYSSLCRLSSLSISQQRTSSFSPLPVFFPSYSCFYPSEAKLREWVNRKCIIFSANVRLREVKVRRKKKRDVQRVTKHEEKRTTNALVVFAAGCVVQSVFFFLSIVGSGGQLLLSSPYTSKMQGGDCLICYILFGE